MGNINTRINLLFSFLFTFIMNSQETEEILTSLENVEWVFEENTILNFNTFNINTGFADIPIAIPILIPIGVPVINYNPNIPLIQGIIIIQDI